MTRRGKGLGSPAEDHQHRAVIAARESRRKIRETSASANARQCDTAIRKFAQATWWVSALETEMRSVGSDVYLSDFGKKIDYDSIVQKHAGALRTVLNNCSAPRPDGYRAPVRNIGRR
jgi:hypothetical protein